MKTLKNHEVPKGVGYDARIGKYINTEVGVPPAELLQILEAHWPGLSQIRIASVGHPSAPRKESNVDLVTLYRDEEAEPTEPPEGISIEEVAEVVTRLCVGHARERLASMSADQRDGFNAAVYYLYLSRAHKPKPTKQKISFETETLDDDFLTSAIVDDDDPRVSALSNAFEMQREMFGTMFEQVTRMTNGTIEMLSRQNNEMHARLVKQSEMSMSHVEPLTKLLYYMGTITIGAWHTSHQAMKSQWDVESIRAEAESRDRRWTATLMMLKEPVKVISSRATEYFSRKFGAAQQTADEDDEDRGVPFDVAARAGQSAGAGAPSHGADGGAREEAGHAPASDQGDESRIPTAAEFAKNFGSLITPAQWGKLGESLTKKELKTVTALFSCETNGELIKIWDSIENGPLSMKLLAFANDLDESQTEAFGVLYSMIQSARE